MTFTISLSGIWVTLLSSCFLVKLFVNVYDILFLERVILYAASSLGLETAVGLSLPEAESYAYAERKSSDGE